MIDRALRHRKLFGGGMRQVGVIAAGALLMGVIFLVLGQLGVLDLVARGFPRALIRGVQLTVGLLFLKIAWTLVTKPGKGFKEHALSQGWALTLALIVLLLALSLRRWPITLAPGQNVVTVTGTRAGRTFTDTVTWTRS